MFLKVTITCLIPNFHPDSHVFIIEKKSLYAPNCHKLTMFNPTPLKQWFKVLGFKPTKLV